MADTDMPTAEAETDTSLVWRLIDTQFLQWVELPVWRHGGDAFGDRW